MLLACQRNAAALVRSEEPIDRRAHLPLKTPRLRRGDRSIADGEQRLMTNSEIIAEGVQRCPEVLHNDVGANPKHGDECTKKNQLGITRSIFRCPDIGLLYGFQPRPTWERIP